jgi:hypothetical protein
LIRDVESYKEESEQTKARADAMEAAGEDEYEVRQQVRPFFLPFPAFSIEHADEPLRNSIEWRRTACR